jgi:hypothetical protein
VSDIWALLGIAPTTDERSIKKAYATQVRVYRPDTHPQEFSQLRQAYELALRLRHAEPVHDAEPAAEAPPESAPQPAETVASEPAAQPAAAPSEAYVMLDGLAQCYREQGEVEAVTLMHAQIASLSSKTIDTRLDYEGMLLSSLLNHTQPPLLITFEAARQFQWASHMHDVEQQVGSYGARRLTVLLELSNRAVFAKRFSSNRWINRLFEANPHLPRIGFLPHITLAKTTAQQWSDVCWESGFAELKHQINTHVAVRLDKLIYSTDILFACIVGFCIWIVGVNANWFGDETLRVCSALAVTLIAMPLPTFWRWFRLQPWTPQVFRKKTEGQNLLSPNHKNKVLVTIGAGVFILLLAISFASPHPTGSPIVQNIAIAVLWIYGIGFAAAIGGGYLGTVWALVAITEHFLTIPLLVIERISDRYEFEQLRQSRVAQWPALRWQQRLKNLPAAWSSERKKAKLRKQEAAQRSPFTSTPEKASNWMWLWFAAMLLIAAIRGISAK